MLAFEVIAKPRLSRKQRAALRTVLAEGPLDSHLKKLPFELGEQAKSAAPMFKQQVAKELSEGKHVSGRMWIQAVLSWSMYPLFTATAGASIFVLSTRPMDSAAYLIAGPLFCFSLGGFLETVKTIFTNPSELRLSTTAKTIYPHLRAKEEAQRLEQAFIDNAPA